MRAPVELRALLAFAAMRSDELFAASRGGCLLFHFRFVAFSSIVADLRSGD